MTPAPPPIHVIACTHTARHLGRTLAGVLAQAHRPASVTVSSDTDDPAIAEVVRTVAAGAGMPVTLVQRAHTGRSRSSQVRNNAVRALVASGATEGVLVFLDGDCVPAPGLLARHGELCGPRTLVLGFRVDLTPEQSERFDDAALAAGRDPVLPSAEQRKTLARRHARYIRQALLRRLGLAKPHKPKLLSANFAVRTADYLRVNGFDELYEGYGQEDDDLGRRLYAAGCRPVVAVGQAVTYHLWHPTRAPGDWHASPNAPRFLAGAAGPFRCERGIESPVPQPDVSVTRFPMRPSPR